MGQGGDLPGAVLFACSRNAVRSPMAAAILKHLAGRRIYVESAGVRPGEPDPFAIAVMEEMGIDMQPAFAYTFIYRAQLDHGLIEHELDHVFTGVFGGKPAINTGEVEDWKFVDLKWLKADMNRHPENYTAWFKLIVNHPELSALSLSS